MAHDKGGSPANPSGAAEPERPARPETWDSLLATRSTEVQEAARAIAGVLMAELPGGVVHFDRADGLLAIATSGATGDLLFTLIPHARWVNLQLADGATLADPDGLIEGTGKRIRHVKISSAEAAGSAAVRKIVQAQIATRRGPGA
jgi:hypothetical protein